MTSLNALASQHPSRTLVPSEVLIWQGGPGGDLFILEHGSLSVERDGVAVTTISSPNAFIGEMSVLLGTPSSATVRAAGHVTVRVIEDARSRLIDDPLLTIELASLVATRLDATTALLVDLAKDHPNKTEQSILARIFSALTLPAQYGAPVSRNYAYASHE
jgi:CRP-like cAMP-binding protein